MKDNSIYKGLGKYKLQCILGPVFKLLEASFELLVPLVIADIIDKGIASGDTHYIAGKCGVLFVLAVVGLICAVTAQYFAAKAATGFSSDLRSKLFRHIQTLSFTETDTLGASTLITRMTSDINQLQNLVNMVVRLLLRSPFVVFGAMIMAFRIDVKSALIFVVVIPLLSLVVFGVMMACMPLYRQIQQKLDKVTLRTRENLTGVRVIRAFCNEEKEIADFENENKTLVDIQRFTGKISAVMNPATFIIINIAMAYLIYTGAVRVDNGILSQGQVVALYNYMSQILVELVKLANLIVTVTKGVACGKRIQLVADTKSSMVFKENAEYTENSDIAVAFENVSLRYKGASADALENISFTVRKGETVGIIGSTGSGKSSLVNMIPRFYDCANGRICVNGTDVRDYPIEALRNKTGIVMQNAVVFSGTIESNIRLGKQDAEIKDIEEAVEIAQASDIVMKKGGISAETEQNGRNLSGGQKQRISIARTMVRRPEILILDDSSSALDAATDAALRKSISELSYDPTVFIVSQRCASVRNADKIIVLDDGKMVGMGTHDELLGSCDVYKEIYMSTADDEDGKEAKANEG